MFNQTMTKQLLLTISTIFIIFIVVNGLDQEARDKCKSLYRIDADVMGTFHLNHYCTLQCNFTNRIRQQETNSGQPCRPNSSDTSVVSIQYTCQSGRCLPLQIPNLSPPTSPFAIPLPNRQNGLLSILSTKAELSTPKLDTFLMICVLNNVAEPIVRLPLEEHYWINRCHSCSSDIVRNTRTPIYVSPCPMSTRYTINQNSRIIFEIWSFDSSQTPQSSRGTLGQFIGGAHLRLKEMIDRRNLGRPYSMQLIDGAAIGSLTTEIEWY